VNGNIAIVLFDQNMIDFVYMLKNRWNSKNLNIVQKL